MTSRAGYPGMTSHEASCRCAQVSEQLRSRRRPFLSIGRAEVLRPLPWFALSAARASRGWRPSFRKGARADRWRASPRPSDRLPLSVSFRQLFRQALLPVVIRRVDDISGAGWGPFGRNPYGPILKDFAATVESEIGAPGHFCPPAAATPWGR